MRTIIILFIGTLLVPSVQASAGRTEQISIVCPTGASHLETLAAREVRRYLYLRTGKPVPIVEAVPTEGSVIVVAQKNRPVLSALGMDAALNASVASLGDQEYLLRSLPRQKGSALLITGGDAAGTLYGAYRFAEHLGVRFYLDGDTIPDGRIALKLPVLDERRSPLFTLRGIQPFHDFPEGPDWWNAENYKAIITQLPKLGMNFIGLHTYPEGGPNAEPTVWIGLPGDVAGDGKVKFSYPSSYYNTSRDTWGYSPKKTSDYIFGASELFEHEAYGPEVMSDASPEPQTADACNVVFDRTAAMLRDAFTLAHTLGVKTCVGTETPLTIPTALQRHLQDAGPDRVGAGRNPADPAVLQELYEGILDRAAKAYPLDYYWLWTPEWWLGNVADDHVQKTIADMLTAVKAANKVRAPFRLATCGWVLGPQSDRVLWDKALPKDMPVSCINRDVGRAPVDPAFAAVRDREKWAIPWLEDDPALTSPQLWVGRMRKDAEDALRYGCTGLMGIHWRTKILGPNVSALAKAAWDQSGWLTKPQSSGALGGAANPTTDDFYLDWAASQFGPNVAADVARIFDRIDGKLPEVAGWVGGPGGFGPDGRPWDAISKDFVFVDELAAIRPRVKGTSNTDRFDYWLSTFNYMRSIARVRWLGAEFERAMQKVEAEKDADAKKRLAQELALPARRELVRGVAQVYRYLLAAVSTTGEMGTIANWEQHIMPGVLTEPGRALERALGEPLPPDAMPSHAYTGPTRIIVPAVRTSIADGESLKLKVIILADKQPKEAALYWRAMGKGKFAKVPLVHAARGVYSVRFPPGGAKGTDLEYYIKAAPGSGKRVYFPATALTMNQTLVVVPRADAALPSAEEHR